MNAGSSVRYMAIGSCAVRSPPCASVSSFRPSGVQRVKWDNRSRELGEGLAWVRVTVIAVLVAFRVWGVE